MHTLFSLPITTKSYLLLSGWLCCLLWVNAANAEEVVSDRQYGRVLYEYFQGDYQVALTQMAIAEQQGGIQHQGLSPELLKGGMSLGFGLEQQALEIFSRLLNDNVAPNIQAQAWFSLARVMYNKGEFTAGYQALSQIDENSLDAFNATSLQEFHYLKAQLLIATGQLDDLDTSIAALNQRTIYMDYLNYNFALQLQQQQQSAEAISLLEGIDQRQYQSLSTGMIGGWFDQWLNAWFDWQPVTADEAEQQALQDRVNVTLGYLHMQAEDYPQAIHAFKSVRLDGIDAQRALLGYGFAAMELQAFQQAISLWQVLQQLPANSTYKQQSWLAVASAYQSLNSPLQALSALELAVAKYQQQAQAIDDAMLQVQQPTYFLPYVRQWQQTAELDITENKGDNLPMRLLSVFSSAQFRQQIMALAELQHVGDELQRWGQQLQSFQLMVDEREQVTQNRAVQLQQNNLLQQLATYQLQREQLAQGIENIEQQQDGHGLLASEQLAQHQQIQRAQQRLQGVIQSQSTQQQPTTEYAQRLQRLQGIISWQADSQYVDNLWQAKQGLRELDKTIEQTQQQQQRLIAAMDQQPQFDQQRQRIAATAMRVKQQSEQYQLVYQNLTQALVNYASQALVQQKQLVQDLLIRAQVEMVRLQDEAYQDLQRQTSEANL
ncbi:hypothetical protein QX776_06590 [Alteromonadaceae bacterium BrNp21-10]|nr:hypothetical protein [Alteromonadaceae bacterium BrNp21-10]